MTSCILFDGINVVNAGSVKRKAEISELEELNFYMHVSLLSYI